MKKIIALFLTTFMILSFSAFAASAAGTDGKVEISFKVGDSTLLINSQSVTVETPYIAGEGSTLVPLRVITEAFGAEVLWEGTEKKIFLSYPDVDITLQIDNIIATVNTHTETLPVAPVLSPNGVTMVPLRFISETFGADVAYDDATKAITVTKEAAGKEGVSLNGITDLARVGDSYYGWSMDTPKEMFMEDRSFDGTSTDYVSNQNENNYLGVYIYYMQEDLTFEKDFSGIKDSFKGYTLLKADKLTDENNNQYMHFRVKDETSYFDYKYYYVGDYRFEVVLNADVDSDEISYLQAISDSFKTNFTDASTTYDLSNVEEDGYRTYTNEKYKLSYKVPKTFVESYSSTENEMRFYSIINDNVSELNFCIYSKSADMTAEKLAKTDNESNAGYKNEKYVTLSTIDSNYQITDTLSGYQYTMTVEGTEKKDFIMYDIFFEVGEYVYNVSLKTSELEKGIKTIIIPSIKADELNFDDIGILLRNDFEKEGSYVSKGTNYEITLPMTWDEVTTPAETGVYLHKESGALLSVVVTQSGEVNSTNMGEIVKEWIETQRKAGAKVVQGMKRDGMNNKNYYTYILCVEKDGEVAYSINYALCHSNKLVLVTFACDQLVYCDQLVADAREIVKSLTLK